MYILYYCGLYTDDPPCGAAEHMCEDTSKCIPAGYIRDGFADCPDASDEYIGT